MPQLPLEVGVMELLRNALTGTLQITSFVLVMMLLVEYLNVTTRGWIGEKLARSGWPQLLGAAILGATPGCLGAFTVVALFSHRAVSLGALVAAMIATSGDESFVMFALIPGVAGPLAIGLLALGFATGWLTDRFGGKLMVGLGDCCDDLEVHDHHVESFNLRQVVGNLRQISFPRALLVGGTLLIILGIIGGVLGGHDHHLAGLGSGSEAVESAPGHVVDGHDHSAVDAATEQHHRSETDALAPEHGDPMKGESVHHEESSAHGHQPERWSWLRLSFLVVSLLALFMVTVAPEHFLDEHLWRHVVRRHLPALSLWTFGALLLMGVLQRAFDPAQWVALSPWLVTGAAALLGVIPQSGPHLMFTTTFAAGLIPLSALVVSSIVQDGHGMLPLLAHSRRAFFVVKMINLLAGILVGIILLLLKV
jgi:hypothetical protein